MYQNAQRFLLVFILLALPQALLAQDADTNGFAHLMTRVNHTKHFISKTLRLKTGKGFYEAVLDSNGLPVLPQAMYHYVYVSYPGQVKTAAAGPFRWFGANDSAARHYADSCRNLGLHVLIYKTAGTSAAKLNARMLRYKDFSVAFILLHEAIHRHKHNVKSKLPYVFEEALCDFVANEFLFQAMGDSLLMDYAAAYRMRHEKIYNSINQALQKQIDPQLCESEIERQLADADAFFSDRYLYPVNNAYLLRFSDYTKHYFELKALYARCKNRKQFFRRVFSLRGSEQKAEARLRKWMR